MLYSFLGRVYVCRSPDEADTRMVSCLFYTGEGDLAVGVGHSTCISLACLPDRCHIQQAYGFLVRSAVSFIGVQSYRIRRPCTGCRNTVGSIKTGDAIILSGTIKWFDATDGFGLIVQEEGGKDVFVHILAVERSSLTGLVDKQKVTYGQRTGRDGRESADDIEMAKAQ